MDHHIVRTRPVAGAVRAFRLTACFLPVLASSVSWAQVEEQIIVDQFGWRAEAERKVVLFAHPVQGQNAGNPYVPGATFEIRRASDGATVYTGAVVAWRAGAVHEDSGDQVWAGDFSGFTTPGTYYAYDPAHGGRSYPFVLAGDVYDDVLEAALRAFYYQRSGTAIPAAYGGNWTHAADHLGPGQDREALRYETGPRAGTARDVSGGWWDAGDYNKYVPYVLTPLWDLMTAYDLYPQAFGDAGNIPESGNGVPDLLDEVKWELDWLLKMQFAADGAVSNRVAALTYDTGTGPAGDIQPRYYTNATTWATASFAAVTALGARLFAAREAAYPGYAATLRAAAEKAWAYLEAEPEMKPASGTDGAEMAATAASSDARDDRRRRVLAAAELYRTTGHPAYKAYFERYYADVDATNDNGVHPFSNQMMDPSAATALTKAYFTYARTPGATPAVVQQIKTRFQHTMDWVIEPAYRDGEDPYRGYMWSGHYTWGSNWIKASWATLPLFAVALNVNPSKHGLYREIAEEYLHYFHGRNPLSLVYLSNMGAYGGEKSMMQMYHSWFQDGSPLYDGAGSQYGPAPGYLAGGPNQYFSVAHIAPPAGEPPMKAFRDWNTGWNGTETENSWEITEPAIYYQAAYVLALAAFVSPAGLGVGVESREPSEAPTRATFLEAAYPNPFTRRTTLTFSLPASEHVTLTVYDVTGRRVATLVDERQEAGLHRVDWEASHLAAGSYFCSLRAGAVVQTRAVMLQP